jgi:hypothetical protein
MTMATSTNTMSTGTTCGALFWVRLGNERQDEGGRSHWAALRPARAIDELRSLRDFRVWLHPESFPAVLLSRVVVGFASLQDERAPRPEDLDGSRVDVGAIERLDASDRAELERAYRRLNSYAESRDLGTERALRP